jgi:hypothetical protein
MWRECEGRVVPPLHSFNHALPFCTELGPPDLDGHQSSQNVKFLYTRIVWIEWRRLNSKAPPHHRTAEPPESSPGKLLTLGYQQTSLPD